MFLGPSQRTCKGRSRQGGGLGRIRLVLGDSGCVWVLLIFGGAS